MSRRAAVHATCRRCGAAILHGPDADLCALTAAVDPWQLDPVAEILALLDGRATYAAFTRGDGRTEIEGRDTFGVTSQPRNGIVVGEHRCGTRPPANAVFVGPEMRTTEYAETPPF